MSSFLASMRVAIASMPLTTTTPTVSVVADGAFAKIHCVCGAVTVDIRDSNMSSGVTDTSHDTFVTSWSEALTGLQLDFSVSGVASSAQASKWGSGVELIVVQIPNLLPFLAGSITQNAILTTAMTTVTGNYANIKVWLTEPPGVAGVREEYLWCVTVRAAVGTSGNTFARTIWPQSTVINYLTTVGSFGRAGVVIPDLGHLGDRAKITAPIVSCSEVVTGGSYVSPGPWPMSWMAGPFGRYYFCPESSCVLYPYGTSGY